MTARSKSARMPPPEDPERDTLDAYRENVAAYGLAQLHQPTPAIT